MHGIMETKHIDISHKLDQSMTVTPTCNTQPEEAIIPVHFLEVLHGMIMGDEIPII
jgi:hypothetical protein